MTLEMVTHIGAGALSIGAGFVALFARKGGAWHARAGTVFVVAMVAMAGLGALIALMIVSRPTAVVGALTAYLVLSSWMTVRRPAGETGRIERWAFGYILAVIAADLFLIVTGRTDEYPVFVPMIFGMIAAIAAFGDWRTLRAGGVAGPARINRHLWRMCAAMLIATMSFFFGQSDEFPEAIRKSALPWLPILTVIAVWLWQANRMRIRRVTVAMKKAPA
jgi:uncharacterized membrane protein